MQRSSQRFVAKWDSQFASQFAADSNLKTFIFVESGEDDLSDRAGYCKEVSLTNGKVISPTAYLEFKDYFYWGYSYDLDVTRLDSLYTQVSADFPKLLSTFGAQPPESMPKKRKAVTTK